MDYGSRICTASLEPNAWSCQSGRVMKAENAQGINQHLLRQTGIDFSRYRNDELLESIGNAATFPVFFVRSLSRPVGLLMGLTVLAALWSDSGLFSGFLVFPGLLFALINGILLGLVLFVRRIRNDMTRVFAISSELCLQALRDIGTARRKLAVDGAAFPSLGEIFHGMNMVVILPALMEVMERRIPFLGGLAARLARRFFSIIDRRLSIAIEKSPGSVKESDAGKSKAEWATWLHTAEGVIHAVNDSMGKVVNAVSRVVSFPFVALFGLAFAVSAAILYAAHATFG